MIGGLHTYCVIGDQKGFVSVYELSTRKLAWRKNLKSAIRSLHIDRKNQLWISTNKTSIHSIKDGALKNKIAGSYSGFSEADSTMWGVGGLRISKFNQYGDSKYTLTKAIHIKLLYDDSMLYASGRTGLDVYNLKMNLITKLENLSNSKVTSLITLDKEFVVIGTIGNGFHLLNKNDFKITSFNATNNFIANDIYQVQKKDSLIWLSTERGLLGLDQKSLSENRAQLHISFSMDFKTERVSYFHVERKSIWTISDYSLKITPNKQKIQVAPIFFYEWIKPFDFESSKGVIQLKFGLISFNNQNIFFRYRINRSNDWSELSTHLINLESVSPGEYDLTIESSFDKVIWSHAVSLPFLIPPPWWNRWYVRFASGILILLAGTVFYKRRVKQYKERNTNLQVINEQQKKLLNAEIEATERERSRIAKDLHDGISTDLVSINLITKRIERKIGRKYILEIDSHLQKTITEIKRIIYGLAPPSLQFGLYNGLQSYFSLISKNTHVQFKFDFMGIEIQDSHTKSIMFRIIQELTLNSLKHSKCSEAHISINSFDDYLNLLYSDNGIGFDPSRIKKGLGLNNIQSRIESLSGQLNFESGTYGIAYSIDIPIKQRP